MSKQIEKHVIGVPPEKMGDSEGWKHLCLKMINHALLDLQRKGPGEHGKVKEHERVRWQKQSLAWFLGDTETSITFSRACVLAGVCPRQVQEANTKAFEQAKRELGEAKRMETANRKAA